MEEEKMEHMLGLDYLYGLAEKGTTESLLTISITERLEAIATALERIAAVQEWQKEEMNGPQK